MNCFVRQHSDLGKYLNYTGNQWRFACGPRSTSKRWFTHDLILMVKGQILYTKRAFLLFPPYTGNLLGASSERVLLAAVGTIHCMS